jgi:retron-type reverse transcriptase
MKFIEKNKILSQNQYGFRENRSTELAISELTNKITKAIDQGEYTIGIFLDLSKAFDTINHKILIQKLQHYGIRGIPQQWFLNYLTNRKQIVKYNQTRSEEMVSHLYYLQTTRLYFIATAVLKHLILLSKLN